MRVLILTQFFPPEPCAASNRVSATAQAIAAAGHYVEVVTGFPNFPSGHIPRPYRGKIHSTEVYGDVLVTRLATFASRNRSSISRILNWALLAAVMCVRVLFRERTDVILVSSPPITLAIPALLGAAVHRAALLADIRDAYPEVAISVGLWRRTSVMARLVGWVADLLYRHARVVMVATHGIDVAVVVRGVDPNKVALVRNGYDSGALAEQAPYRRTPGERIIAYAGNMGLVAGAEVILEAAALLRSRPEFRFVMVGGGNDANNLQERARALALENVTFTGVVPRGVALGALKDADVAIVPLRANILDSVPTKLLDALGVACPVILCGDGEGRDFLERTGGGWCVPPEDPSALATLLEDLDPDECRQRGLTGRAYVQTHCDRASILAQVVRLVEAQKPPRMVIVPPQLSEVG